MKQMKIANYYLNILDIDGSEVAALFADEMVKWDGSDSWDDVVGSFCDTDVLDMLYRKAFEISKANKLSISDFKFDFAGYGHWRVSYTSPTGGVHIRTTDNMKLIDATKNEEDPSQDDLKKLRDLCVKL